MATRRFRFKLALLLISAALASAASLVEISGLRAWSRPESTRVMVELSGPSEYRADRSHSPERLVVDVLNARTSISQRRFAAQQVDDARVRSMSIEEPAPGIARIVFDLKGAVSYRITRLTAPSRLMIEIEPADSGWDAKLASSEPPLEKAAVARPEVRQPSEDATGSLTRALGLKVHRIVIDAGHGGHDDGTTGSHGLREKDVALEVALSLARLIRSRTDLEVVMTRSSDVFVPLEERTRIANESQADLFLSIHANSSRSSSAAGTETFYLNLTDSRGALDVAARENLYAGRSVSDLNDLVRAIAITDKITESQAFANSIEKSVSAKMTRSNASAGDRGVKRAPFVVLIGASMPAALVEVGFLSNARDEANLGDAAYRQKMAEALFLGMTQYVESFSGVRLAAQTIR